MQIVHFGHACVLLDTGSARLLIDPGTFSTGFESTEGLDAVLITHQHFDHIDVQRLPALLAANPGAKLVVDQDTVPTVEPLGLEFTVATPGDELRLGGARVNVIGGRHANVYGDMPGCTNVGYLVDEGAFLHPGDSLVRPEQEVDVLGLPTSGPWLKLAEAIDYLREVAPRVAVPIHEALFTEVGLNLAVTMFTNLKQEQSSVNLLARGELTKV
ncbi:MBL fold metallo-hydrolase [Kutzneria viridogrisea]|uniref:Metallo-beta-lactamase domain-containing protein n=2 Tax=Kutzneria TaxID=43356 RepID=W5WUT4_9PSEU|nr:MBL fold metallo-hydrolase [Kutzneria albida]AHI01920.1 hypothetical protein KALB_8563 [Kutzneria albida DSM 43870]MBA8929658.1 L-ascorbate metabolism protein UlaG (beta-lactamase superfamily) [Kutzneria viridogrisea]